MRQLSAHDAAFLATDTAHANANVTLIHIYDQRTAPGGVVRFKSILQAIESRMAELPLFRQKLVRVPLSLDHPYWVDDEHFDLEYHVRHIALPKPGDWRQFCIQASRIHARPLDMNRPLWEIHIIEGLDGFLDLPAGSFAMLTKTHHAALDVEQGSEITMLLHDLGAEPAAPAPPAPWFPQPAPGRLALAARGVARTVTAPWNLARPSTPLGASSWVGRAWRRALPALWELANELMSPQERVPPTRFNAIVSPHRVFETRRFALEEFKAIRRLVPGATVNDVVLAVCGGALRRYLQGHDELPATNLTTLAPFYVRGEAVGAAAGASASTSKGAEPASEAGAKPGAEPDTEAGGDGRAPQIAFARIDLGTTLGDAVQRLAHVHAQTASSAVIGRALGARELAEAGHQLPAATLALTAKLMGRTAADFWRRAPGANCTITNVPGPSEPLYLCGARMTYFSAIMPITDGNGLVFAVTSYAGQLIISPTSCRELMPDPAAFAQCVRESFQELLAAARAQGSRRKVPPAKAARKRIRREPKLAVAGTRAKAPKAMKAAKVAKAVKATKAAQPAEGMSATAASPTRRRATPARPRASASGRRSPTTPRG